MVLPPVILLWAKPGQTALERLGGGKGCLTYPHNACNFCIQYTVFWRVSGLSLPLQPFCGFRLSRCESVEEALEVHKIVRAKHFDELGCTLYSIILLPGNVAQSRSSQELFGTRE